MSNKTYDTFKTIALIVIPVLAFIASLVDIWGIPYGSSITATLTAIDSLVGGLVIVAKTVYEKKKEEELEGGKND